MPPIIRVENLSKRYLIGHQVPGEGLRHRLERALTAPFRRSQPQELSPPGSPLAASTEEFWALRDVNCEVEQGEVVGIIGRNGAGKSTLLKILSRITEPTRGRVTINGRVASLLEVGTGFHPELTGRENIFLNGAILGMTKKEIKAKFDEIVDFAEVERFIDTPVKRYSSGMYVRLAFAVAAHLDPEVLIVDEVLAVGDVQFQQKCLGKMKEVSSGEGRTVLFVSHNLSAVQNLCGKALYLKDGRGVAFGACLDVLKLYQASTQSQPTGKVPEPSPENRGRAYVLSVKLEDDQGVEKLFFKLGEPWTLRMRFRVVKEQAGFVAALGVRSLGGVNVQTAWTRPQNLATADYEVVFRQANVNLCAGTYVLVAGLSAADRAIQQFEAVQLDILADQHGADHVPLPAGAGLVVNSMLWSIGAVS